MKSLPLTAYHRTLKRRTGTRVLRAQGRIPAVIYGRLHQPQPLEINSIDLENLTHHSASENLLIDLAVEQDARPKRLALLQEVQHHPLTGQVLHVDLHEVVENEKVTVTVPVETIGEAEGVKTGGGVLEHVLFKLKVRALPRDLPEFIEIDVTKLLVGQAVHLGEITPPQGVEILGDRNISVVACAIPRAEVVEETAAAAAPAAVEVIKEKKEEAPGGAAAAAAPPAAEKKEKEKEKAKK